MAAREFVPVAGFARTVQALHLDRLAARARNEARTSYDALEGSRNIPPILLSFRIARPHSRPPHYSEPSYVHGGPFVTRAIRLKKDGTPVLNDDQTVVED